MNTEHYFNYYYYFIFNFHKWKTKCLEDSGMILFIHLFVSFDFDNLYKYSSIKPIHTHFKKAKRIYRIISVVVL